MKKYYLFFLLSSSIGPAMAQNEKEAAFTLLDSISQHSFRATFLYASQSQSDQSLTTFDEGGQIAIHGNKCRLTLPEQEIINDGQTIWTYLKEANEVQITSYNPKQAEPTPWTIFTNYRHLYTLGHYATHPHRVTIELLAKDAKNYLPTISITANPDTGYIEYVEVMDSNQILHVFLITDFAYDLTFDKAFFSFNAEAHQGVEVIDMR